MNDPWTWLRTLFRFPTPAGFLPAGSLPVAWLPAGSAPGSVPLEAPGLEPLAGPPGTAFAASVGGMSGTASLEHAA